MITLASLFDGIGAWQLAAGRAGIKPVWSSEINSFCVKISKKHFPNTLQLGDINHIIDAPKVDIITASSPCQNLSIAGKREGLNGVQSSLFFKATELVRRLNPKFFIWENVTGAFTSNGGNDFRAILQELLQEPVPLPEYWANAGLVDGRNCQIAWRTLDAQFFGVPQRRRRIFLVADFRARRAAKILFEPQSMSRNSTPRSQSKCKTPATIRNATDVAIFDMTHPNEVLRSVKGDKANCLNARMGTGGNQIPLFVFGIGRDAFNQGKNAKDKPTIERDLQPPLTARGAAAVATNVIRRLIPLECERLMGLPDYWTAGASDTQRYKAIGNGVAQPVVDWLLKRLHTIIEKEVKHHD